MLLFRQKRVYNNIKIQRRITLNYQLYVDNVIGLFKEVYMLIKDFYNQMEAKSKKIDAIFAFVYNDYNTYVDDPHLEECFNKEEVRDILNSVSDLFAEIKEFNSESEFIKWCCTLKSHNKHIYVYTMAQNITGNSRRTLIPAICQYYGFININADAYMSAIGCNKKVIYDLLKQYGYNEIVPPTIFIDMMTKINVKDIKLKLGNDLVLKPINESCCIDVSVLHNPDNTLLTDSINNLLRKHDQIMLQKFIPGKEIGVTVFWHINKAYAMKPIELLFFKEKTYLTHMDSYYTNYKLTECNVPESLLNICEKMSKDLGFYCMTRYDFRFDGSNYYLFDISPNPTLNGYTSSNIAVQKTIECDYTGILRLLTYEKFNLFEPTFNGTK